MIEIRVVNSDGVPGEMLPDWAELTFSQDLAGAGTLTFNYPRSGRHSNLLQHGVSLVVLVDGREPKNARFTFDEESGSKISESEGGTKSLGATSNLSRFDQLTVSPAVGSQFADENLFTYTDKSAGSIALSTITNGMSRANAQGALPGWLNWPLSKFSASVDSSGAAWPTTYDVRFNPGQSVTEVLEWMFTNGFAEAVMQGKDLHLYNPSSHGRDLTTGDTPLILSTGNDVTEAGYQATSKELITALLVLGEENTCAWVIDTDAIAEHGYREGVLNVSNASTQGTLIAAGEAYLGLKSRVRKSYTYSVSALYLQTAPEVSPPRPFIDFEVGDTILLMDREETISSRVRLLSASWPSAQAATVNLTVNDFFGEREAEFERRLSRLGG